MISPDTLIVFAHSISRPDYTPVLSGLGAAGLVAGMAWYSARAQRKIATETIATQRVLGEAGTLAQREIAEATTTTQRQLGESATVTQREIAEKNVLAQIEIARRTNVVAARREWARDLRIAVSKFVGSARAIHRLTPISVKGSAAEEQRRSHERELFIRVSQIALLLDLRKQSHRAVGVATRTAGEWAYLGDAGVAKGDAATNPAVAAARAYPTFTDVLTALNNAVSVILEENWEKVRKGE
jgi:transcriptional regulator with XRE-family HTH domain